MIFDLSGLLKEGELKIALNRATIDNIFLSALYGEDENSKIKIPSEKFLPQDFFYLLGLKESSLDYKKILDDKHGIGAVGMYQFRMPALQEIGYIDKKGNWIGKDDIFSTADFINSPRIQEKAVREFADKNYKYMEVYKVLPLLGQKIKGKVSSFPITISGMLAASHKEGGPMTAKYLNSLEKNREGVYYLPYEKYSGYKLRSFLAIETRLREFSEIGSK